MAERLNHCLPGSPLLVVQRACGPCCFHDSDDFRQYKEVLFAALWDCKVHLHAYCLLQDHVRLLITPMQSGAVPRLLVQSSREHTRLRREREGRQVEIWEQRYRGRGVPQDEGILRYYRHVERYPVELGLAYAAGAYRWSSFHHNGYGLGDPLITEHPVFSRLVEDGTARHHYRAMLDAAMLPPVGGQAPVPTGSHRVL